MTWPGTTQVARSAARPGVNAQYICDISIIIAILSNVILILLLFVVVVVLWYSYGISKFQAVTFYVIISARVPASGGYFSP